MGVGPFMSLFPRVFRVVPNKKSLIRDCFSLVKEGFSWRIPLRRALRQLEESEFEHLLGLLSNIFLSRNDNDVRIWKTSCSGFSQLRPSL